MRAQSRRRRMWPLLLAALWAGPRPVVAQRVSAARSGFVPTSSDVAQPAQAAPQDSSESLISARLMRLPAWSAPIASAVIPGLGQARLGQERFVAYMAVEAYLILQYAKNNNEANNSAASYRAIARDVARRGFPGTHPDTIWQYYEKLEKFNASGQFSLAVGGATVPETDPTTYNGQQWAQARNVYGISLDDPNPQARSTYGQAIAYYESRAIPLAYEWSWENASLERDLYTRTIGQSNDASRRATADVIVLIANHIVSTIDAFSSFRLMQASPGVIGAGARITVP